MSTLSLFEDEPSTPGKSVSIAKAGKQAPLSKAQKSFNNLIQQIEKKRALLAEWQAAILRYQKKHASEMAPLIEDSNKLRMEFVRKLDLAVGQKGLSKTDRHMIADIIIEVSGDLLSQRDDAELKAIYNRHSRSDFDSDQAAYSDGLKSIFEDELGMTLGDDVDMSSPEDILRHLQAQFEAGQQESSRQTKKSARQQAREAKLEAEAKQASQSIREVFRKLTSALHPDREPDPQERERKTALMQRANQAYEKNDLLKLLELQLELEHIDQNALDNLGEDRLKHYNKVLKEQLGELEQEILLIEHNFAMQFNLPPYAAPSPKHVERHLASDIVGIQHAIRDLQADLAMLDDAKKIKIWLKTIRAQPIMDDFDMPPF